jgi:hypothetical protein
MSNSTITQNNCNENNIQKNKIEIKILEQNNLTTSTDNNETVSNNILNPKNTFEKLKQLQILIQKH